MPDSQTETPDSTGEVRHAAMTRCHVGGIRSVSPRPSAMDEAAMRALVPRATLGAERKERDVSHRNRLFAGGNVDAALSFLGAEDLRIPERRVVAERGARIERAAGADVSCREIG